MRNERLAVWAFVVFSIFAIAQQVTPPNIKELEKRRSAEVVNGKKMFDWMTDLKSTDPSIKMKAVATLKAYGSAAREATIPLLEALKEKDASTRVNACITLGMIGFPEQEKTNGLTRIAGLLTDHQGIVRYQAAIALSNFGSSANFAVPNLVKLTKDPITWEIRAAACSALANAGLRDSAGIDAQAWTALLGVLHDPCFEVKFAALQGLLYMGKPLTPGDITIESNALQSLFNERHEVLAIWSRLCFMRLNNVSEPQLTAIAKHLKSSKPDARAEACKAFAIIGVEAKSKVKEIMIHLNDKDAVTAIWACAAVAQMKDAGMAAVPKLKALTLAENVDDGVKQAAQQALSRLGADGKTIETKLTTKPGEQKDLEKRRKAQEFNGKTLSDWIADLRNSDPSIKLKAVATIKVYGAAAREANGLLVRALTDKDASTRVNACITLGAIGFNDKDREAGISHIQTLLNDREGIVRFQAATVLSNFGPEANSAVPSLAKLSKDNITWEIRSAACTALATTGLLASKGIDPRAWTALLEVLHDPCVEVRFAALKGLLYLGKPTAVADVSKESTALQTVFTDKQETVAMWARLCYMRINGVSEVHLAEISKHLRDPNHEVRTEACKAFAIIGPEAKSQVNALINCFDDKESLTAIWAIAAVAQMKEPGAVAIPKLKKMSVEHQDAGVRGAAIEAIKRLGGDVPVK